MSRNAVTPLCRRVRQQIIGRLEICEESFRLQAGNLVLHGVLHRPVAAQDALLLAHSAGSNYNSPLLQAVSRAVAAEGVLVLRFDLPFRQIHRFGPPRPGDAANDRNGIRAALEELRRLVPGRVFAGGHSYGGRQTSMVAAEVPELVSGLLLLSYPLHPPRRPQQMRTEHLPRLRCPALFVHGTRDPFATAGEMSEALRLIPAPTKLELVENAGHDLGFSGKKHNEAAAQRAADQFREFHLQRESN